MVTLGLDIGGTNIRSGFVHDDLRVESFLTVKTGDVLWQCGKMDGENRSEDEKLASTKLVAPKLVAHIAELVNGETKIHGSKPCRIILGVPSTVDKNARFIYSTPNIAGLNNVPIADMVEAALHIPCYVQRDVCLLLLYDIHAHNLGGASGFIAGFYVGTGLGNALAFKGGIVTGKNGAAAELGHIPVPGRDDICGCGKRGCIELYSSGKRLDEIRAACYSSLSIEEMLSNHVNDAVIKEFFDALGAAIAAEINILDPDHVILGGGVIFLENFPRAALESAILTHTRKPYPSKNLSFLYSRPSQENGVIGAALYAKGNIK